MRGWHARGVSERPGQLALETNIRGEHALRRSHERASAAAGYLLSQVARIRRLGVRALLAAGKRQRIPVLVDVATLDVDLAVDLRPPDVLSPVFALRIEAVHAGALAPQGRTGRELQFRWRGIAVIEGPVGMCFADPAVIAMTGHGRSLRRFEVAPPIDTEGPAFRSGSKRRRDRLVAAFRRR